MSSSNELSDISDITWDPMTIFSENFNSDCAVVVLNAKILLKPDILFKIWKAAKIKVTVDGGTDRWLNFLSETKSSKIEAIEQEFWPDLVVGDFDSIHTDTLMKVKNRGITVIETVDPNETDYTKALKKLQEHCISNNIKIDFVYTICETTGRFDHLIGNINTLYKCERFFKNIKVIQISSDSLTWLLAIGRHRINVSKYLVDKSSWCGLIPFGNSNNRISTTGLKWNLEDQCLEFGKLVSTSNTYVHTEVTIKTNALIIWTMGIEPLVEKCKYTYSDLCNIT